MRARRATPGRWDERRLRRVDQHRLPQASEDEGRRSINQMLLQPFVNYNFADAPGRYLTFSPVVTADWKADSGERWTVPLGLGIGQITRFGKQPVNLQASAYYNVERPDNAAQMAVASAGAVPVPEVMRRSCAPVHWHSDVVHGRVPEQGDMSGKAGRRRVHEQNPPRLP